jgi:hypothetical protein
MGKKQKQVDLLKKDLEKESKRRERQLTGAHSTLATFMWLLSGALLI